jgi:hypothetical protein
MTEMNALVFESEEYALDYSRGIIMNLGLEAVIKPARLVQIIYPNQLHQVEKGYLVITPNGKGLQDLESKANELENKAREKYDTLKEQLADLESQHGFADE